MPWASSVLSDGLTSSSPTTAAMAIIWRMVGACMLWLRS